MSVIQSLGSWYRTRQTIVQLTGLLVLLVAPVPFIAGMIELAFGNESALQESVRALLSFVPVLDMVSLVAILIGVYGGLSVLLALDSTKRTQGVLLAAGSVIAFAYIGVNGVMFTAMSSADWIVVFTTLFATVRIIGNKPFSQLNIDSVGVFGAVQSGEDDPLEFPRAAALLWMFVAVFIIISFHEAYTQYPQVLTTHDSSLDVYLPSLTEYEWANPTGTMSTHIVASLVFIFASKSFLQYNNTKRVAIIGPPRSGKTHLIIGMYVQAQNNNRNPRNTSSYITDEKDAIVDTGDWADETVATVEEMGFEYTGEGLLTENIVVDGLDYPGEYSYFIPSGLELVDSGMAIPQAPVDTAPPQGVELGTTPIGQQIAESDHVDTSDWTHLVENFNDGYEQRFRKEIRETRARRTGRADQTSAAAAYWYMINAVLPRLTRADTVIFVFDVEAHLTWEGDSAATNHVDIGYYQRIADVINAQRIFGVATKTDTLESEFTSEHHLKPDVDYDLFRKYISNRLLDGPFAGELQGLQLMPYPVFIANDQATGDGPVVPLRTFGIDKLLEKLG